MNMYKIRSITLIFGKYLQMS